MDAVASLSKSYLIIFRTSIEIQSKTDRDCDFAPVGVDSGVRFRENGGC